MPFTIPDHEASAREAIQRGVITARLEHLAQVPEPQQSSEHQARVSALSILNELAGPTSVIGTPWTPGWPPIEPPVNGWGDGVAFGERTLQEDQLWLSNESGVVIDGLYFDGALDSEYTYMPGRPSNAHVCIYLDNCTDITIRNIDFNRVSEPIAVYGGENILVEYCRADGITGPGLRVGEQTGNFIQTYGSPSGVRVLNNKIITGQGYGDPADILSLFSASDSELGFNQVDGTGYLDGRYGTGAILGDGGGNDNRVHNNTFLNSGQVAIGVAGGYRNIVEDNVIYSELGPRFRQHRSVLLGFLR